MDCGILTRDEIVLSNGVKLERYPEPPEPEHFLQGRRRNERENFSGLELEPDLGYCPGSTIGLFFIGKFL